MISRISVGQGTQTEESADGNSGSLRKVKNEGARFIATVFQWKSKTPDH